MENRIKSIAIGGFDGMHIAHQQLFNKLDKYGAIVVIQTDYENLTPSTTRTLHTNFPIFYYPLKDIKHLEGEEFLKLLKSKFPSLEKIVVGYDFRFGHNASYDVMKLKQIFDGEVIIVDEFKSNGISIHSRVIRELLKNGDITKANKYLGYPYTIYGSHIKGQGLGKKEFVPTINLKVENFLLPKSGVYITNTLMDTKQYRSITFLGHRNTTDGTFAIETHILEDLPTNPQNNIAIKFIKYLRENKKFESFTKLKDQIYKDIEEAKRY